MLLSVAAAIPSSFLRADLFHAFVVRALLLLSLCKRRRRSSRATVRFRTLTTLQRPP